MNKVKELPDMKKELIEFAKNNKIEKPETGVIVVTKPIIQKNTTSKRPGLTLGKKPAFTLTHGID